MSKLDEVRDRLSTTWDNGMTIGELIAVLKQIQEADGNLAIKVVELGGAIILRDLRVVAVQERLEDGKRFVVLDS